MKTTIRTEVKGKRPVNLNALNKVFEQFDGKEIEITVDLAKKKRTNPQNSYWWGVVIPMVHMGILETGELISKEQIHEMLKMKFLSFDIPIDADGHFETFTKTTSGLTTTEFNDLIEKVQQWGAEWLGIIIPSPNENIEIES